MERMTMDPHQDAAKPGLAPTQREQLDEAIQLAEEALRQNEDDGHVWQFLGLLRHRMRDLKRAQAALETASLLVPLKPAARFALADCYLRTGLRKLAADLYDDVALDPLCPTDLLGGVAAGLGSLGRFESALEVCRSLVRREPESHEGHFGIAFYLRRLGASVAIALPSAMRAHELAPSISLYTIAVASMLAHQGRHEDARDMLRDLDMTTVACRCCVQRVSAILHHGQSGLATPESLPPPQSNDAQGSKHAL